MENLKLWKSTLLVIVFTFVLAGCKDDAEVISEIEVSSISFVDFAATMIVEEERSFSVEATYSDGSQAVVDAAWNSSDPSVISVGSDDVLRALKEGTSTISASFEGKVTTEQIDVITNISEIYTDSTSYAVFRYESQSLPQVKANKLDGSVIDVDVNWEVLDETVAKITDGKIEALSVGNTILRGKLKDFFVDVEIEVTPNKVVSISVKNSIEELIVTHTHQFDVMVELESGRIFENPDSLSIMTESEFVDMYDNKSFRGIKEGTAEIDFSFDGFDSSESFFVNAVEEVEVHPFLATPMAGAENVMNVAALIFVPTKDGINVDCDAIPEYWEKGCDRTLEWLKKRINQTAANAKFGQEESTKYHGYEDPSANPFIGFQIVKMIYVYEQIAIGDVPVPGSNQNPKRFDADKFDAFERVGMVDIINQHNIKEVWLTYGNEPEADWPTWNPEIHDNDKVLGDNESNMYALTTQEISNSQRVNDLPAAKHTYIVYSHSLTGMGLGNTWLHGWGHQIEGEMEFVSQQQDGNSDLFLQSFCGFEQEEANGGHFGWSNENFLGTRCGNIHFPPNGKDHYDYRNEQPVMSDIKDWNPQNTGVKELTNNSTWAEIPYNWPNLYNDIDIIDGLDQFLEEQWYIFWFQNFPNKTSDIPYGNQKITNWWEYRIDWDRANQEQIGLHTGPFLRGRSDRSFTSKVPKGYCNYHGFKGSSFSR